MNIEQGISNDDPPRRMKYRSHSLRNSSFFGHYSIFIYHYDVITNDSVSA